MRRLLVAALLLAGLCAPPAVLAQVGTPGVGNPPPTPVFLDTDFKLQSGNTTTAFDARAAVNMTVRLPAYAGDFLTTTSSGQPNFYPASGTYPHLQTLFDPTNGVKFFYREDADDETYGFDITPPGYANFGYFNFGSVYSGMAVQSGQTALIAGGASHVIVEPAGYNTVTPAVSLLDGTAANFIKMLSGGYGVFAVSSPAQRQVTVTVTDTTPSIIAGTVQLCGFTDAFPGQTTKECESLDFSGGAQAITTANFYGWVTTIKSSGFNVLGGAGDEKIKAEWTTGDPGPVLFLTNLVNHTKTRFQDMTGGANWRPLTRMGCADVLGCDLDLIGNLYGFTTIIVEAGSQTITCVPGAFFKVSAAHSLEEYDSLSLVRNPSNVIIQTAYSDN